MDVKYPLYVGNISQVHLKAILPTEVHWARIQEVVTIKEMERTVHVELHGQVLSNHGETWNSRRT